MVLLTFHGEPRSDTAEDPHGVGWNVKFPLSVLGVLAVLAGGLNLVPIEKLSGGALHVAFLEEYLYRDVGLLTHGEHYGGLLETYAGYQSAYIGSEATTVLLGAGLGLGLALLGAGSAYGLYRGSEPVRHTAKLGGLRTLLMHNYYQDEYQVWLARGFTVRLAAAANTFDQGVIDGAVNAVSSVSLFAGDRLRRIQTGIVTNYAALLLLSLLALLAVFAVLGGWL
jgi:NADH-quinone oxidoreductase subunit L